MRLRLSLILLALAGIAAFLVVPGPRPADHKARLAQAPQPRVQEFEDRSRPPGQTSEGIAGPNAVSQLPPGVLLKPRIVKEVAWRMAPGVHYRRWEQIDRRGRIRAHLITVNPAKPGVSVDDVSGQTVVDREPLTNLVARDGGMAGINGGFFDIHDTGAPLGVGRDRQRGMLHASLGTWDKAFWISGEGVPRIGTAVLDARIDQLPQIDITNVNGARVKIAGVGIYTPDWGTTSGYRITDGQTRGVRQVVIENGRVVSNRGSITAGDKITGLVLVGRGPGAQALAQMKVGSIATVGWHLRGQPQMAVGGEKILLRDGVRKVENNRELHPRTAIGIDRGTGRILLLVIDGRSNRSRGYTLVELARMMRQLGAEDALNLDGGGSSTMVGRGRGGERKVLNTPSDGSQRWIPEGFVVHYNRPKRS